MIVVKFGGTSLAGTERMRAAARIVAAHRRDSSVVCVVSAMAGVTDTLLRVAEQVTTRTMTETPTGITSGATALPALRIQHQSVLTALTTTTSSTPATTSITSQFEAAWAALEADLERLRCLHAAPGVSDDLPAHALAAFSGWGERLSVLLFAAALASENISPSIFDGEPVLLAPRPIFPAGEASAAAAHPWERFTPSVAATHAAIAPAIARQLQAGSVPVLPGYLGRTADGLVTILGRNGSDFSAAVVAAALRATVLVLYSDVAGIHRADPRIVPDAEPLPALTYADAAEIACLGARVLHPATLRPLAAAGIPLHLRSALAPDDAGTDIGDAAFVRARVRARERSSWVVVARPLMGEQFPFGLPAESASELIEVAGVFLPHADLPAREDDALDCAPMPLARVTHASPNDAPYSGALDLLATAPRPLGLALSGHHLSITVPREESASAQRRLYAALWRATSTHSAGSPSSVETPAGRRRTS